MTGGVSLNLGIAIGGVGISGAKGIAHTMSLNFATGTYKKDGTTYPDFASFLAANGTFARGGAQAYDLKMSQLWAINAPRITSEGLLIEPASTNWAVQSEFASGWANDGATLTPNVITDPAGTTKATSMLEGVGTGVPHQTSRFSMPFTAASGAPIIQSVAVKRQVGTRNVQLLQFSGDFSVQWGASFNTSTGANIALFTGSMSGVTAAVQALANSYNRISVAGFRSPAAADTGFSYVLSMIDASNAATYNGDGTSILDVFGLQIETGPTTGYFSTHPTSYIPVTTAAATRNADAFSINVPAGLNSATVTFDDGSTQIINGIGGGLWNVPVNLNRPIIKAIDFL